ncbi:hypothetical protein QAD02_007125 [Eretmocerus hayati]|uniref:Uncharacterized protein n=1 Tax=Eretmocerus hayati TaxID=131215 RepID=A0ACC2N406_9HYME|nr:hypothetical protein QAD02_007125 [Eretmocerus hayati]
MRRCELRSKLVLFPVISGEDALVDQRNVIQWQDVPKGIIAEYSEEDILDLDKLGLFLSAWLRITEETVRACFLKAGSIKDNGIGHQINNADTQRAEKVLGDLLQPFGISSRDFVSADNRIETEDLPLDIQDLIESHTGKSIDCSEEGQENVESLASGDEDPFD